MSFTAQKKLAEGNIACDVEYGGRGKIVQLEAVELQKPAEERMDWKSEPPQQVGDEAHPLSLGWVWRALCLLPTIIGG